MRNTSAYGVHFPYVSEWSYVPQQLEVASLTCRFEALSSAGRPGDGYCHPDDVYVPPYTKVTITGGTLYLSSIPKYDEYRVAYARRDTWNISHLFFSIQVKECENVKKIPDTGISLRSPLKVSESVDAATSYVFTGNSLRIPAIGLGMETPIPIVHVYYNEGSSELGWDLSTLGNYVGELEGGSYLPYAGNSALTGHYYSMGVFKNLEYLKELTMYILAGKKKLEEERNTTLVELQKKAEQSGLPEDAEKAKDFANKCDRFEKKIYDLELTRTIAMQTGPQIRMVQSSDTVMAEKIQSTIVNTIPLWKNQMVIAIGIEHSTQAAKAEREVNDMTNKLLKQNADALKVATIESAKEAERGIVDIETLRHTDRKSTRLNSSH